MSSLFRLWAEVQLWTALSSVVQNCPPAFRNLSWLHLKNTHILMWHRSEICLYSECQKTYKLWLNYGCPYVLWKIVFLKGLFFYIIFSLCIPNSQRQFCFSTQCQKCQVVLNTNSPLSCLWVPSTSFLKSKVFPIWLCGPELCCFTCLYYVVWDCESYAFTT